MIEERLKTYNEKHCWQHDIRRNALKADLREVVAKGYSRGYIRSLRIRDFILQMEKKSEVFDEAREFIKRYEWLGKIGLYPTHIFTARLAGGILAGVVIMDMPCAFSKMLGEGTRRIERLVSRGACISWSPKNLASSLIMFSIKWMVANTRFRLFMAYADPEALELGTIYQACNFYYLGQKSGTRCQYKNENGRWVSDRYFRSRSVYKKVAREANVDWDMNWQQGDRVLFDRMPVVLARLIKDKSKEYQASCEKRDVKLKHKYVYVLGTTKTETKQLRNTFEELNTLYEYPKERGD
jgi:hypothetical protein